MIAKLHEQHQAQIKMQNLLKKLKKSIWKKNHEGESLSDIIKNIVKEKFKIHESNMLVWTNYLRKLMI